MIKVPGISFGHINPLNVFEDFGSAISPESKDVYFRLSIKWGYVAVYENAYSNTKSLNMESSKFTPLPFRVCVVKLKNILFDKIGQLIDVLHTEDRDLG